MTLPPWKPETAEERREFTRWIHAELDREDEGRQHGDAVARKMIINRARILSIAEETGDAVVFPQPKPKVGAPKKSLDDYTDLDWAERDVPRIRQLFRQHWHKRNRTVAPLAETIAAERWELSEAETNKLIDKFQRKS